jgi:hypothetical protein
MHRACAENGAFAPSLNTMNNFAPDSSTSRPPREHARFLRSGALGGSLAVALTLALGLAWPSARAETVAKTVQPAPIKPDAKPPAKALVKAKPASAKVAPVELPPEAASEEQVSVAERVYYGDYFCDFKQTVQIKASEKYPAYVDLRFGPSNYLMKPVLSSTGAVRLEDVKGTTLMVQIASKSMLLNVKTGTRLVDECVCPKQRELIEAARQAAEREAQQTASSSSP